MDIRLLGSTGTDQRPQQRLVLAALAVDAGRLVPWGALIDRVWGDDPPAQARQTLYTHIARIRKSAPVTRVTGGYLLDVDPQRVDLHRFGGLVDAARAAAAQPPAGGPGPADLLRAALDLWHGEPLAGLPGEWAERVRRHWRGRHLDAVLAWAEAELDRDNPHPALPVLAALGDEFPLSEPLAATLIRALDRAGRTAEALAHYAATRARLADELGIDPGDELRELHRKLVGEPSPRPAAGPAQLPGIAPGFVGRRRQLARLDELAAADVATVLVTGMAGVGKTSLAVHWARANRARFPDGQLFLDLRGFEPHESAVEPAAALRAVLDSLGVPPQRIPTDPQAQAGLYRGLLADRRMLVLLDNARDIEQVRPLLPGAPGCLALVTSRNQLAGLIAGMGAHAVGLEPLDDHEARELLELRLGGRVAEQPQAAERIIARCARLPLALAIVAARVAVQPDLELSVLADDMRTAPVLDAFAAGSDADLRATFSWSYRGLSEPAARMFRLLGVNIVATVSLPVAASIAELPTAAARRLLDELTQAQLLVAQSGQRWVIHDLLKAYADELAGAEERRDAGRRLLDHYLHHGLRAAAALEPNRQAITVPELSPTPAGQPPTTLDEAMCWMRAEHLAVQAAAVRAHHDGHDRHAWQLAWCLFTYHRRQGLGPEWIETQQVAVRAARRAGAIAGQAHSHYQLAAALYRYGSPAQAREEVLRSLAHFASLADHYGQASGHYLLAQQSERDGDYAAALAEAEVVHRHYRLAGHVAGCGRSLGAVGYYQMRLGRSDIGLAQCEAALVLLRQARDVTGEAFNWDSIGYIHRSQGRPHEAVRAYAEAVRIHRELHDRNNLAPTLENLGDARAAAGDHEGARASWAEALALLAELGRTDTDALAAKLTG